ncbi:MAG: radical SAM protein, partial [Phycicoccus sp.]
ERHHVAMGTNTDPYQRAEGRYRLMPDVIRALAGSGTPFSVLTKGTLLGRDLPLLAAAGTQVEVRVSISLALLDPALHATLEPGTPTPRARLDLVRRIRAAGLPCGVLIAPILPYLTDSEPQLRALFGELTAAGATSIGGMPLHLRPGAREWFLTWLAREHPRLVERYTALYRRGPYVSRRYADDLGARLRAVEDDVRRSSRRDAGVPAAGPRAVRGPGAAPVTGQRAGAGPGQPPDERRVCHGRVSAST